ncbi:MAG: tetratricopeptide repeat protein [Myxococcales bacterium]|nr:tetratricopeptide repeat protein [Myxococcales bacterium]
MVSNVVIPLTEELEGVAPTGTEESAASLDPSAEGRRASNMEPESILSNVVSLREELLVSRERTALQILSELRRLQTEQQLGYVHVRGMPGSGRFALVRALRTLAAGDYEIQWVVRAQHPALAAHDLANLAVRLCVATTEEALIHPTGAAVRALRWLSGNRRVLYVFVGVTSLDTLDPFIKEMTTGAVLLLGGVVGELPTTSVIELPPVTLDEALRILQWDHSESAELCAKTMGGSLLALRLSRCFHSSGLMTRGMVTKAVHQSLKRHQNPVVGLLKILLHDLEKKSPHLVDLLSFLSFFSPDGIDFKLITLETHLLPGTLVDLFSEESTAGGAADAVATLEKWGLVQTRDGLVFLHPFVQQTIRDNLNQERLPVFGVAALGVLTTAFRFDRERPSDWIRAAQLCPHVLAAITNSRGIPGIALHFAQLEYQLAKYLDAIQLPSVALVCAQEALGRRMSTLGEDAIAVLESYRQCGGMERTRGNWLGACHYFEKLVAAAQRIFQGSDETQLVEPLTELAITLAHMGQANRALSQVERGLAIALSSAGIDYHPIVARALAGYAAVLRLVGATKEAIACTNRAITVWEKVAESTNSAAIARILAEWGAELLREGDSEVAGRALKLALGMLPDLADTQAFRSTINRNLGVALFVRGKFAEAKNRLEESMDVMRRHSGSKMCYETVPILWELARISRTMGDYVTARNYLDKALQLQRYVFPDERHPDFVVTNYELGVTQLALTNPNAAREALNAALVLHRRFIRVGQDDLQIATILHELAFVLLSQGDLNTAQSYYERAYALKVQHYETREHPDVANTESMFGQLLWKLGQKEKARELLHHSEWVFSSRYGSEHPKTIALNRLLEIVR